MIERNQLLVSHDTLECGVCARTLLTGERAMFFTDGDEQSRLLCELCAPTAHVLGWGRPAEHWEPVGRLSVREATARVLGTRDGR